VGIAGGTQQEAIVQDAYDLGSSCVPFAPEDLFQDVNAPVGAIEGARPSGNQSADVKTVQNLLNQIAPSEGGQQDGSGGLAVDGICGPLTRDAIVTFQKRQFAAFKPDGIVDPTARTINRLNVLAFPEVDDILLAKGRAAVATAAHFISVTIARMQFVELAIRNPLGRGALFNNKNHLDLYNFHFHLNRSTDQLRDLNRVRDTYQLMLTVAGHVPSGPNQEPAFGFVDVVPPNTTRADLPFAFTTPGGFLFFQGVSGEREGALERGDMIYLTRALLDLQEIAVVYALIHELAHFVGGRRDTKDHIRDRATVPRQRLKYTQLNALEAATNADSYSQYAFEVNTGQRMDPTRFRV
jgi:hypothetical protein